MKGTVLCGTAVHAADPPPPACALRTWLPTRSVSCRVCPALPHPPPHLPPPAGAVLFTTPGIEVYPDWWFGKGATGSPSAALHLAQPRRLAGSCCPHLRFAPHPPTPPAPLAYTAPICRSHSAAGCHQQLLCGVQPDADPGTVHRAGGVHQPQCGGLLHRAGAPGWHWARCGGAPLAVLGARNAPVHPIPVPALLPVTHMCTLTVQVAASRCCQGATARPSPSLASASSRSGASSSA